MNVKHKKPSEMKEKVIRFRVTEEEHTRFMEQAKIKGFNTFSDYARFLLDKDKKDRTE